MALPKTDRSWDEFHDPEIVDWKRARAVIEHENLLTNHRCTWLLLSHAFLFAIYGAVLKELLSKLEHENGRTDATTLDLSDTVSIYGWTLVVIAVVGMAVCFHLWAGLRAANEHHNRIRDWWQNSGHDLSQHPEICGHNPKLLRELDYSFFPLIFLVAWFTLVVLPFHAYLGPLLSLWPYALMTLLVSAVFALGWRAKSFFDRRRQKRGSPPTEESGRRTTPCQ